MTDPKPANGRRRTTLRPLGGISDVVWQALIAGLCTIVLAWMQLNNTNKLQEVAKDQESQSNIVKETLEVSTKKSSDSLEQIGKTTEMTHNLVNSAMRAQLKLTADLSRWKADQTKDPVDVQASRLANEKLKHHDAQQTMADDDAKTKAVEKAKNDAEAKVNAGGK